MVKSAELERVRRHNPRYEGVVTNPYEGWILGNGDLGASVTLGSHEFCADLGKNDVWDSRLEGLAEDYVLRHDDLIRYSRDYGFSWSQNPYRNPQRWDRQPENVTVHRASPYLHSHFSRPCPKRVGRIRVTHPGLSQTRVLSELRLEDGTLFVEFGFPNGTLRVECFVDGTCNAVFLRVQAEGTPPWFQLWLEKESDQVDPSLPAPEGKQIETHGFVVTQTIPEGCGVAEFVWTLGGRFPEYTFAGQTCSRPLELAGRARQTCRLEDGDSVTLAVGVATTRDGTGDPRERALQVVGNPDFVSRHRAHAESWAGFWGRSFIELADRDLEAIWYRDLFGQACHIRPGAQGPGLNANVAMSDASPFHGDYHWNHNVQKHYLAALPTNHPEWIEVYADLVEHLTPSFQFLARLIFDLEGVYCDLISFPYAPPERANVHNVYGRALAVTGWVGQPLWWYYEYTLDSDWLRRRAYPYLKQAAIFYWNYLEKYQDETGWIYPSIRLEKPGWERDFKGNCNVVTDLVMFRNAFSWAIRASEILDTDQDWHRRWEDGRRRVPPVKYGRNPEGEGWIALDEHWEEMDSETRMHQARYERWGGGGWTVFPGEYIGGHESGGLADAARDLLEPIDPRRAYETDRSTQSMIHSISSMIPFLRLGMRHKFTMIRDTILAHRLPTGQASGFGCSAGELPPGELHYYWRMVENKYFGALAPVEMLLQSQGGLLRFFPFWPKDQDARFGGLRARGAFVVGARYSGTNGTIEAEIHSLRGAPCTILCPSDTAISFQDPSKAPALRSRNDRVTFSTKPDTTYQLRFTPKR